MIRKRKWHQRRVCVLVKKRTRFHRITGSPKKNSRNILLLQKRFYVVPFSYFIWHWKQLFMWSMLLDRVILLVDVILCFSLPWTLTMRWIFCLVILRAPLHHLLPNLLFVPPPNLLLRWVSWALGKIPKIKFYMDPLTKQLFFFVCLFFFFL